MTALNSGCTRMRKTTFLLALSFDVFSCFCPSHFVPLANNVPPLKPKKIATLQQLQQYSSAATYFYVPINSTQ